MRLFLKAFRTGITARGKASIVFACFGIVLSLLPSLISYELGAFTNSVQSVFEGKGPLDQAFWMLGLLIFLYVLKQSYDSLRSYYSSADAELIMR